MRTLARDFAMSVSPKQEAARHPDHDLCLSRVRHNAGETSGRQANRRQTCHPAKASTLLNGGVESRRRNAGEKRRKKHLAQDVPGLGRAGLQSPFADGLLKFLRCW